MRRRGEREDSRYGARRGHLHQVLISSGCLSSSDTAACAPPGRIRFATLPRRGMARTRTSRRRRKGLRTPARAVRHGTSVSRQARNLRICNLQVTEELPHWRSITKQSAHSLSERSQIESTWRLGTMNAWPLERGIYQRKRARHHS